MSFSYGTVAGRQQSYDPVKLQYLQLALYLRQIAVESLKFVLRRQASCQIR